MTPPPLPSESPETAQRDMGGSQTSPLRPSVRVQPGRQSHPVKVKSVHQASVEIDSRGDDSFSKPVVPSTAGHDREPEGPGSSHNFAQFFGSKLFTDVCFVVGKEHAEIRAHKIILAAQSSQMMDLLLEKTDRVSLQEYEPGAFRAALCWIYTRRAPTKADALGALDIAETYALDDLSICAYTVICNGVGSMSEASALLLQAA